jgi:hypothetical protein
VVRPELQQNFVAVGRRADLAAGPSSTLEVVDPTVVRGLRDTPARSLTDVTAQPAALRFSVR